MRKKQRVLATLLAAAVAFGMTACKQQAEPTLPEEEIPAKPPVQQETVPDASEPGLPEESISKEQASLVDSDLMLHRLEDNLLDPVAAAIRLNQKDSSMKTELNAALLQEVAGFLCQNYTVLRFNAQVDLRGAVYMNIIGDKESHDVYVQQWINGDGEEKTFVQVEEGDMMGQYVYDPTTYGALLEVLNGWQYENTITVEGDYQLLDSMEQLERLKSGHYKMAYLQQYGEQLLFGVKSANHGIFESINTGTGETLYSFQTEKPVLDVRKTSLEGYDYYVITKDSVHYRSIDDAGLKLEFSIPKSVQEKMLKRSDLPLFDVDYVNDELVYVSEEGVILSNQAGKRNDLILRHEALYTLLNLEAESEQIPVYAAPKLLYNGRMIVSPILLQGEKQQWVGFSIFNLMNGTSKDVLFDSMDSFMYPDDQTVRIYDGQKIYEMDIFTREVVEQQWSCAVNETAFVDDMQKMIFWRKTMDHKAELLTVSLSAPEQERCLLTVNGDNSELYGKAGDYALVGWSDGNGDFMAVVNCAAEE